MLSRITCLAATLALAPLAAVAEGKLHHIAIHVDQNDPAVIAMALNNVQNIHTHYAAQGDSVMIEVVAYGPGVDMFVEGKSPVADRIATMALELESVSFAACGNTVTAMEKKAGQSVPLIAEAQVVPSGAVRLIELQQQGYAYLRP